MTYYYRALLSIVLCLFTFLKSSAQSSDNELQPGYYVVVAAYASTKEDLAQAYKEKLKTEGHDAKYGFNSSRGFYFVHINYFTNLKDGLHSMLATRKKGVFTDAWVRVVPGDIKMPEESVSSAPDQKVSPDSSKEDVSRQTETQEVTPDPIEEPQEEIVQYNPMTLGNTEVFLSLFNATNNRIIDGEIEVVDTERSRSIQKVKGNEYMILPDPKSTSGQLSFIAEVFGYRKIQHEISYKTPLADTTKSYVDLIGTTFVINFDMVRYRMGDIATLYQVYFYNDAAIMLPESKYQLGELLQLMNENPNYKIRLHGHTNGNYHGKIVTAGPDQDLFSLNNEATSTIGSAKQLSQLRGEVIKEYLVKNGVSADRIEVKAWGGKRPVHDRRSANAKRNVRVEVEILQD
jgi:outer membrane protein OmpA-like peptidoglycan-associated protein